MSESGDETSAQMMPDFGVAPSTRMPLRAMLPLALLAVVCLVVGLWLHRAADASRNQISSEATAALRQIDGLRVASPEDETDFSSWYMAASEAPVQAVLRHLQKCRPGSDCQAQRRAAYPVLQQAVATWLEGAYAATQSRRNLGDGLVVLALILMGIVVALAVFTARRTGAASAIAGSDVQASTWAAKALEERSQQLFAAQIQAYEGERFAAFGEIAAALSHGLKTPLASIRAAAQLAQAKLDPNNPVRGQLNDIVEAVDRAVGQVQRHLKASGAVALQPQSVALSSLIREVDAGVQASCQSRQITFSASLGGDELHVSGDAELLLMAIQNLVDNAIAATPDGGEVAIFAQQQGGGEGAESASGWVEIKITDQGSGIDPRVAAGSETSSSKAEGSGLGLSISRRIITRHGGRLELEGREGGGTVARLILPGQVSTSPEASA